MKREERVFIMDIVGQIRSFDYCREMDSKQEDVERPLLQAVRYMVFAKAGDSIEIRWQTLSHRGLNHSIL